MKVTQEQALGDLSVDTEFSSHEFLNAHRQSCLLRNLSGLFGVRQRFPESRAIVLSCNCG